MTTLDAGCGHAKRGDVGMDAAAGPGIDVVHNLAQLPWPFKDEEFERVYMYDVLEHLPWDDQPDSKELLFRVVEEARRVLKPGGVLEVSVPHEKNPHAWGVPYHRRAFNEYSFTYFVPPTYLRAGMEQRPERPLFRAMKQVVHRRFSIGGLNQYHVRKHLPRVYRAMVYLHLGWKDKITVELFK
ncbi:MAG: class I SAM-dependent methyltransferase [Thermoplasmata archaeon]|nr:class I SAM-dependent methyltransferase [Thermoplasmata archaeon]